MLSPDRKKNMVLLNLNSCKDFLGRCIVFMEKCISDDRRKDFNFPSHEKKKILSGS
jgi:hypothetical protein